jgi:hypothetical protein
MQPTPADHMLAFFRAFMREQRRERYVYLFENDLAKLKENAARVLDDIDPQYLTEDLHLRQIPNHDVVGAFYEIERGRVTFACLNDVMQRQPTFDAIFSVSPGKLGALLFHERRRYVVRA